MLRTRAPAKVNFFLEITGRRPDGYHTLSTLFQTLSLADHLTFQPAPGLSLSCSDPALPTDESNLALRAATRLRALLKETRGARIHLEKNVPMGAGLGGGSSDAAAVLKALLRLWKRRVNAGELRALAASLGADVPFFLTGGFCLAAGIGDALKPLKPLPKTWLVLVYPGFGVSTKEAYARVRVPVKNPRTAPQSIADGLFNRFEEFVFPSHPELPALKQELLAAGAAAALMSGSGSSVFGLAPSAGSGRKILAALRPRYPCSWLVHTQP